MYTYSRKITYDNRIATQLKNTTPFILLQGYLLQDRLVLYLIKGNCSIKLQN